ncbi:hypothetical protein HPB48_013417 [Haemaphysalis longicornis]|uniref:Carboxylesterase type B domain-containing protein n=1 Tax=Haemaphysalis longicornis TaxID=44386 RepID=A0A9J6FY26_HAELO|nr:hypothetical protein HPB48_013417 [Haemaphysalis longicornis]
MDTISKVIKQPHNQMISKVIPEILFVSCAMYIQVSGMKVLVGFSDDEGPALLSFINRGFRIRLYNVAEQVRSVLSHYYGFAPEDAKNITSYYDKDQGAGNFAEELFSDLLAVCPVRLFAELLHAWGNRVHTYVLHRTHFAASESGVLRGQSVRLLFGYPILQQAEESERALSTRVISHWAHFLKLGASCERCTL